MSWFCKANFFDNYIADPGGYYDQCTSSGDNNKKISRFQKQFRKIPGSFFTEDVIPRMPAKHIVWLSAKQFKKMPEESLKTLCLQDSFWHNLSGEGLAAFWKKDNLNKTKEIVLGKTPLIPWQTVLSGYDDPGPGYFKFAVFALSEEQRRAMAAFLSDSDNRDKKKDEKLTVLIDNTLFFKYSQLLKAENNSSYLLRKIARQIPVSYVFKIINSGNLADAEKKRLLAAEPKFMERIAYSTDFAEFFEIMKNGRLTDIEKKQLLDAVKTIPDENQKIPKELICQQHLFQEGVRLLSNAFPENGYRCIPANSFTKELIPRLFPVILINFSKEQFEEIPPDRLAEMNSLQLEAFRDYHWNLLSIEGLTALWKNENTKSVVLKKLASIPTEILLKSRPEDALERKDFQEIIPHLPDGCLTKLAESLSDPTAYNAKKSQKLIDLIIAASADKSIYLLKNKNNSPHLLEKIAGLTSPKIFLEIMRSDRLTNEEKERLLAAAPSIKRAIFD